MKGRTLRGLLSKVDQRRVYFVNGEVQTGKIDLYKGSAIMASVLVVDEEAYNACKTKVFGERKVMALGKNIPSLDIVNLILSITGEGTSQYRPEVLAVIWAIECNFNKYPPNNTKNSNGSVDIGPAQINYPTWLGPEFKSSHIIDLRRRVLGTNLKNGIFNGNPKENLTYAWTTVIPKLGGPVTYNSLSKKRPNAVAALEPELKRFFTCLLAAIWLETPTMPSRLGDLA